MRTLRLNFVFFFVLTVSFSILLDGSNHSFNSISDTFEEISILSRNETKIFLFAKNTIKNQIEKIESKHVLEKCLVFDTALPLVAFISKIRCYLHLFQLF